MAPFILHNKILILFRNPSHLYFQMGSCHSSGDNYLSRGSMQPMTCLVRNLYAGQEATVRTGHGTTYWFLIGKGVRQGCILSPCLFNLYAEYIMRNTGLEEAQAGIKIAGRNINNLRYAVEKVMATLSSTLAWKISWMGEPGGLPSMGSDTTEST